MAEQDFSSHLGYADPDHGDEGVPHVEVVVPRTGHLVLPCYADGMTTDDLNRVETVGGQVDVA